MDPQQTVCEESTVLFGGVPSIPSPEVFAAAQKNNPLWFRLFEKAYTEFAKQPAHAGIYPVPGTGPATLEQIWLLQTTFGIQPYCLLVYPVPEDQTKRIQRLIRYPAEKVVATLKDLQRVTGMVCSTTLHYDGTTGHCITIRSYDEHRDRFVYHDPWPARSLLCKENNMADVDAQSEGKDWSVTAKELERVIFASFVFPDLWARLQGVEFDVMFDEWNKSEFFKFFHLKLIAEAPEDGMKRRTYSVGPFKKDIDLRIDCLENGKIVDALLVLNWSWKKQNYMLDVDLVKSFVAAFAPTPDKGAYADLSVALWNLRVPEFANATRNKKPHESPVVDCLQAFMGLVEMASMKTDFGNLSFQNRVVKEGPIQEIEFTLS